MLLVVLLLCCSLCIYMKKKENCIYSIHKMAICIIISKKKKETKVGKKEQKVTVSLYLSNIGCSRIGVEHIPFRIWPLCRIILSIV